MGKITIEAFRNLALTFPEVTEQPNFEKTSFRVNKKIFATLDTKHKLACLKLSLTDQDAFSLFDKTVVYAVANKWSKQGWTNVNFETIPEEMLHDALRAAYCEVAPEKLAKLVRRPAIE